MDFYKTKSDMIKGSDYKEVHKKVLVLIYKTLINTKRRPYIRSAYFNKNKIFLDYFWKHLNQKNWHDRMRRLKFLINGIELLKNSTIPPIIKKNPNKKHEVFYKFKGMTNDNKKFFVQIKCNLKRKRKYLMSIFPE